MKSQKSVISIFLVGIFIALIPKSSFSQTLKDIQGKVRDKSDQSSLPGVSVKVKNYPNSTATDASGNFSIQTKATDTLVFSFIGFHSQEVAVNNQSLLTVEMQAELSALNEVVVIGYGTQRRKDMTGAISSIK